MLGVVSKTQKRTSTFTTRFDVHTRTSNVGQTTSGQTLAARRRACMEDTTSLAGLVGSTVQRCHTTKPGISIRAKSWHCRERKQLLNGIMSDNLLTAIPRFREIQGGYYRHGLSRCYDMLRLIRNRRCKVWYGLLLKQPSNQIVHEYEARLSF